MLKPQASTDEWNVAHYRLDDYLRAHGIRDRIWQSRLLLKILDEAMVRHRQDPSQSPITHTHHAAEEFIEKWLRSARDFGALPAERVVSTGKLYLYLMDAMDRWPDAFLSEGTPPADLRGELTAISFVPNPVLEVSRMVPREPELPCAMPATTLNRGWRWIGLLVAGVLAAVFAFARR